jgi:hypothetical protein
MDNAKHDLGVVKWLRTIAAVGVCTRCNREFKVPMPEMNRLRAHQKVSDDNSPSTSASTRMWANPLRRFRERPGKPSSFAHSE